MKKTIIAAVLCWAVVAVQAQERTKGKVIIPNPVSEAFANTYPGIKAHWGKEKDGTYEASFTKQGMKMSATYQASGVLVETETDITIKDLPATVQAYVKDKRKGARITEAARIAKANGDINYEAELQGVDLIFDAKGNLVKEMKE